MAPSGATGGRRDAWSKRVLALTILVAGAFGRRSEKPS